MAKLKPIEQLAGDVKEGDLIVLKLENEGYNPVGYVRLSSTNKRNKSISISTVSSSNMANPTNELLKFQSKQGTYIQKGKYLGSKIEFYEVLRRAKKQ
jgi:hypothetical protein